MTIRPLHRRALAIEVPSARGGGRAPRAPVSRLGVGPRRVLVAIDPSPTRTAVTLGLRCLRLEALVGHDRADLFELLADRPAPLVLGEQFDGVPADRLLAMLRAAGCTIPAFVIVGDPLRHDGRTSWLRRCAEAIAAAR